MAMTAVKSGVETVGGQSTREGSKDIEGDDDGSEGPGVGVYGKVVWERCQCQWSDRVRGRGGRQGHARAKGRRADDER